MEGLRIEEVIEMTRKRIFYAVIGPVSLPLIDVEISVAFLTLQALKGHLQKDYADNQDESLFFTLIEQTPTL